MAWGVVGQDRAVEVLRRGLSTGRVSHAYLLTGLPRVGKSTLARALAQALNCAETDPPCGQCRPCRLIARGVHPDVATIELRAGKTRISVDEIAALQRDAALRPMEGRHKVYLLLDAELLQANAANRLLKTLEEPPETVVLVLTAPDAEQLLPTLVSRCQQVRLVTVPEATIAAHLREHLGLEPSQVELLARLADGRVGWAIEAASDLTLLDERVNRIADLRALLDGDRLARLRVSRSLAERWSTKTDAVREALRTWVTWWRDLALVQVGLPERVRNVDEQRHLQADAPRFGSGASAAAVARLEQALDDLDRNVNPRLALDVALLALPARNGAS
jgi:DNA polymerase-3 subunit delta'